MEELDSDDSDIQGVDLGSGEKRFASDPLHFTGYDLATTTRARKGYAIEEPESESESSGESEEAEIEGAGMQVAIRDKDETLVQSALSRIRRAQEKGKGEVKLKKEELDALERRRKMMQSAATAKDKKGKRKGSGSSASSESERRRRRKENMITIPLAPAEKPVSRKKGKSKRTEEEYNPPPANPPGMLIAGPDGLMYAPVGYQSQGTSSRDSPIRTRSYTGRSQSRGPPSAFTYQTVVPRHSSEGSRPPSSSNNSSRRPLPDDQEWRPSNARRESLSRTGYIDPFAFQIPSESPPVPQQYMQQQYSNRHGSGPAEISYSSVLHNLPGGYPAAVRANSDPTFRRRDTGRDELANSSTEDESSDSGSGGTRVYVEEPVVVKTKSASRKPVASSRGKKKGKGK